MLYSKKVCVSLGQLLLGVGAELQQTHENRRHVHIRLPHREAAADQIDGCAPDGAVGWQLGAGRLEEEERQGFTWETERQLLISILTRAVIRTVCRWKYWCSANKASVTTHINIISHASEHARNLSVKI